MKVKLISFGYHYGIPEEYGAVFDARSIKNPHNNKQLRKLNGLDDAVQAEVFSTAGAKKLLVQILNKVEAAQRDELLIPPSHLLDTFVIGVGCSFGRHRSVAIVKRASEILECEVEHRDIDKERK